MAKLRIKGKAADLQGAGRKGGKLVLDGEILETFDDARYDASDEMMGETSSANRVYALKATVKAGDHKAVLAVNGKEFEADFTTSAETKKVTFKIAKSGIIGLITGKPYSIKVKAK